MDAQQIIKDKRKRKPIRVYNCLKCKNNFTNQNCIYKKVGEIIGFAETKTICPYCKELTKYKYKGIKE